MRHYAYASFTGHKRGSNCPLVPQRSYGPGDEADIFEVVQHRLAASTVDTYPDDLKLDPDSSKFNRKFQQFGHKGQQSFRSKDIFWRYSKTHTQAHYHAPIALRGSLKCRLPFVSTSQVLSYTVKQYDLNNVNLMHVYTKKLLMDGARFFVALDTN